MSNLTSEQLKFIEDIQDGFSRINKVSEPVGRLIDVSSIIDEEKKRSDRDNEIKLIQSGHDKIRSEMAKRDYELLKPDIEALGLKIEKRHDSILIKTTVQHGGYITISYNFSLKKEYTNEYDSSYPRKTVYSNPVPSAEVEMYSHVTAERIEDVVSNEKFKAKLSKLYRVQNEAKK